MKMKKDNVKQAGACMSASQEKARRLYRRNSEEQAKRAVKHKLGMYPPAQVANNTTADGLNALAAVRAELHKMRLGKQHLSLQFWQNLIKEWGLTGTVVQNLPQPEKEQTFAKELDLALRHMHNTNPAHKNVSRLQRHLMYTNTLTQTEMYGLLCASYPSRSLSSGMSAVALESVLDFIARSGSHEQHQTYSEITKDTFDEILTMQFQQSKSDGMSGSHWLRAHKTKVALFLDVHTACRSDSAVNDAQPADEDDVQELIKSSEVGAVMFAAEAQLLETQAFATDVMKRLQELEMTGVEETDNYFFQQGAHAQRRAV